MDSRLGQSRELVLRHNLLRERLLRVNILFWYILHIAKLIIQILRNGQKSGFEAKKFFLILKRSRKQGFGKAIVAIFAGR
jgi:hypothetical protein